VVRAFGPRGPHAEAVVAMGEWIQASGAPPEEIDLQVLREVASRSPKTREGQLAAKLIG
jgi:hypothetical protein